jgi:hypothetical protein
MKHENHTPTGAFKVRGGLIHLERLARAFPDLPGIISATRGNHGQSLAFAGSRVGIPVTIVVPHGNSVEKNAAMKALGARLIEHGENFDAARVEAMRRAAQDGLTSRRRSIPILYSEWRRGRWNCCAGRRRSTLSSCRSALVRGFAVRSASAICWEYVPKSSACRASARPPMHGRWLLGIRSNSLKLIRALTGWLYAFRTLRRSRSFVRASQGLLQSRTTRLPRRCAPTGRIRTISRREPGRASRGLASGKGHDGRKADRSGAVRRQYRFRSVSRLACSVNYSAASSAWSSSP